MGVQTKLKVGTFKHIEAELYSYWDTVNEIKLLRLEIMNRPKDVDENVGGGRSNLPGDPTGRTAVILLTHRKLEQMERVAEAIRTVFEGLDEDKKRLVQLKYWTKPQTLTWEGIAQQLRISRAQAFRWREQIICEIASHLGWW